LNEEGNMAEKKTRIDDLQILSNIVAKDAAEQQTLWPPSSSLNLSSLAHNASSAHNPSSMCASDERYMAANKTRIDDIFHPLSNIVAKDEPEQQTLCPPSSSLNLSSVSSLAPNPSSLYMSVNGVDIGGKIVGTGSALYVVDETRAYHLVLVLKLQIFASQIVLQGFVFRNIISCDEYELLPSPQSITVASFQEGVQLVPSWMRKSRTSWPDFVVFVQVLTECSDPSEFYLKNVGSSPSPMLSCDKTAILYSFARELFDSVRALLATRNRGEKLLFSWNLGRGTTVLKDFFREHTNKEKVMMSCYFSPLSLLLGSDYHFCSESDYVCEGWGF
jgi:hypothetical protein